MKIFRICPEMPVSMEYIKKRRSKLNNLLFEDLIELYRFENILLPGGWKSSMESLGHEVFEVVYGDVYSQGRWLHKSENVEKITEKNNFLDFILLEQINYFEPDVIFIYTGALYRVDLKLRLLIRKNCPSVKLIVCLWGDEVPKDISPNIFFGEVDEIFSCTSGYFKYFNKLGFNTTLTPSAFDTRYSQFKPKNNNDIKKDIDVCFIGNTGYGDWDHLGRYNNLSNLFQNFKVEFWGKEKNQATFSYFSFKFVKLFYFVPLILSNWILSKLSRIILKLPFASRTSFSDFLKRQINLNKLTSFKSKVDRKFYKKLLRDYFLKLDPFIEMKPLSKKFSRNYNGVLLSGHDYFNVIARSKIVLNFHRDEDNDFANIRCFETAGTGSFLLTDKKKQMIEELFKEDHIAGFNNLNECLDLIRYYLKNEEERESMALNCKRHVLNNHTVDHRNKIISNRLKTLMSNRKEKKVIDIKPVNLKVYYDLRSRPISFDFMFFLQFCYINMLDFPKHSKLIIELIIPQDDNFFKQNFDWSFEEMKDRISRIIYQLTSFFHNFEIKEKIVSQDFDLENYKKTDTTHFIPDWNQDDHHSEYYRIVNSNPNKIFPLKSSLPNKKFVQSWMNGLKYKQTISITIRKSNQFEERNTDEDETLKFIDYVNSFNNFNIVIIPDTDNSSKIENNDKIVVFSGASLDFNRRLALYESCNLNFFLNNGPCIAAELDKNIKSRLFKLEVDTVPHCTKEFIEWQGYTYKESPKYNNNAKWVWENDSFKFMKQEFDEFFNV